MRVGRLACLALPLLALPVVLPAQGPGEVRVMSFNIRYGTAEDGENRWELRREFVAETVRAFRPDLLGTQETLAFQRDFLAEKLPGFECVSAGRDDGRERGEMAALFFRSARFERLDAGHFWLSETPDQPGSKSWDSALPRIVTWVRLRDRERRAAPPLTYFNTHFDHRGEQARRESARLLRRRVDAAAATGPVVVTGDFNAAEESEPYRLFFRPQGGEADLLADTFRVANPTRSPHEGTFSGFRAGSDSGARIDWIAASRHFRVLQASIDRTARDGRTPSDHYPVTAVLAPR